MADEKLVKFLTDNPEPTKDKVEEIAKDKSLVFRAFELLGSLFKNVDNKQYDKKEIDKGMKIESEHTDEPILQKVITRGHLKEDKEYNTHLEQMEEKYAWFKLNSKTAIVKIPNYEFTGETVQIHKLADYIGEYGNITGYRCVPSDDVTTIIYKLKG